MKPTDVLKEEHKAIKLMLRVLDVVCNRLESGERVDHEDFEKILKFIRIFADRCHHGKEEDVLFPALEEVGIPREGGPIGVMLMEHDMGRSYVRAMSEAIARCKGGDVKAISNIISNARNYIALLTQHIEKEDNILFLMADNTLPEEKQNRILKEFERIEHERIGIGKHEELHKLLHRLKESYLE